MHNGGDNSLRSVPKAFPKEGRHPWERGGNASTFRGLKKR